MRLGEVGWIPISGYHLGFSLPTIATPNAHHRIEGCLGRAATRFLSSGSPPRSKRFPDLPTRPLLSSLFSRDGYPQSGARVFGGRKRGRPAQVVATQRSIPLEHQFGCAGLYWPIAGENHSPVVRRHGASRDMFILSVSICTTHPSQRLDWRPLAHIN